MRIFRVVSLSIAVLALCALAAPVASAANGSISGTVTAENGGALLPGVEVCATSNLHRECVATGNDGVYTVPGLIEGDYEVVFSPAPNTNYLLQAYPGKAPPEDGDPIHVSEGESVSGKNAKLKSGGQIIGRVTDSGTGNGIAGIEACGARAGAGHETCDLTDAGGNYAIVGLQTGSYTVFFDPAATEYVFQVYKGITDLQAEGTPVAVTAGAETKNINDTLSVGASISGRVTDAATGAGLGEIEVCVTGTTINEFFPECVLTLGSGAYSVRGLLPGTYQVGFSEDPNPEFSDGYDTQFFDGKLRFEEATPIPLSSAQARTGVDAHLHKTGSSETPPPGASVPITKIGTGLITTGNRPTPTATKKLTCKKGFKKKTVKGKARCVKSKKKKHKH